MSTDKDFGLLWKQQKVAAIPDIKEIIRQGTKTKHTIRNKAVRNLFFSLFAIAYYIFFIIYFQPKMATTITGAMLILLAIIVYQVVSVSILPMLLKDDLSLNTKEYLDKMILLKRKQTFLNKRIFTIFFIIISVGLFTFMLEFALMLSTVWVVVIYSATSAFLAFIWIYIRPRKMKKQLNALNEIITTVEHIDNQITSNEHNP